MSDDFVTVATFINLPEAEAAKLHIESNGIPANVVDAEIVSMDWLLGNAVGNVKLQVPQSRAEAATALLNVVTEERRKRREAADEDDWDAPDDDLCLSCGAPMENAAECPQCGWSWAEEASEEA